MFPHTQTNNCSRTNYEAGPYTLGGTASAFFISQVAPTRSFRSTKLTHFDYSARSTVSTVLKTRCGECVRTRFVRVQAGTTTELSAFGIKQSTERFCLECNQACSQLLRKYVLLGYTLDHRSNSVQGACL